jgi:hypothetical protein
MAAHKAGSMRVIGTDTIVAELPVGLLQVEY